MPELTPPVILHGGNGGWEITQPPEPGCSPHPSTGSLTIKNGQAELVATHPPFSDETCSSAGSVYTFNGAFVAQPAVPGPQDTEPSAEDPTVTSESAAADGAPDSAAADPDAQDESGPGATFAAVAIGLAGAAAGAGTLVRRSRRDTSAPAPSIGSALPQVRPTPDNCRQLTVPSGPSSAIRVRAVTHEQPRITVSRAADGSMDNPTELR